MHVQLHIHGPTFQRPVVRYSEETLANENLNGYNNIYLKFIYYCITQISKCNNLCSHNEILEHRAELVLPSIREY